MADQADTSRFLQFAIDSSVTSGVAAFLFDILLITFIKFLVQLFCSSANLYLVYDKRRAISPTKSSFSSLTGGPVGPLQLARFSSVLIAIVTASVIALGFSINGKTVDVYEQQVFRSVVEIDTRRPATIDYGREFERYGERTFISKRLSAMSDSFVCQRNNYTTTEMYAFAYKDVDLNFDMVSRYTKLSGGECVKTPVFNYSKVVRRYRMMPQVRPARCHINKLEPTFIDDQRNGTAESTVSSCDFVLDRFQCFRDDRTACAAVGYRDETGSTFMYRIPNINFPSQHDVVQVDGGFTQEQGRQIARNVAFLSTAGFTGGVANLANIAVTHVSHDQALARRVNGAQQVSEVDLLLAVPIIATLGAVTVLLTVLSISFWLMVVYRKGRIGYNKFCTVSDMLEMACKNGDGGAGRFRKQRNARAYLGISKRNPEVVVVDEDEKNTCCDSQWAENEIGALLTIHADTIAACDFLRINEAQR